MRSKPLAQCTHAISTNYRRGLHLKGSDSVMEKNLWKGKLGQGHKTKPNVSTKQRKQNWEITLACHMTWVPFSVILLAPFVCIVPGEAANTLDRAKCRTRLNFIWRCTLWSNGQNRTCHSDWTADIRTNEALFVQACLEKEKEKIMSEKYKEKSDAENEWKREERMNERKKEHGKWMKSYNNYRMYI